MQKNPPATDRRSTSLRLHGGSKRSLGSTELGAAYRIAALLPAPVARILFRAAVRCSSRQWLSALVASNESAQWKVWILSLLWHRRSFSRECILYSIEHLITHNRFVISFAFQIAAGKTNPSRVDRVLQHFGKALLRKHQAVWCA